MAQLGVLGRMGLSMQGFDDQAVVFVPITSVAQPFELSLKRTQFFESLTNVLQVFVQSLSGLCAIARVLPIQIEQSADFRE